MKTILNFYRLFIDHMILCLLVFFFTGRIAYSQHEIKVKFNNLRDTAIILGHHFASSLLPDDTIRLDRQGNGVFTGKEKLKEGMYFLFLPSKVLFDFLVGENQNFSLQLDTTDLIGKAASHGSIDNEVFFAYEKYLAEKRKTQQKLQGQYRAETDTVKKNQIRDQLSSIDKEVLDEINHIQDMNKGTLVADFIRATRDIEVPDFPKDSHGHVLDSSFKYQYYRNHYFDNMDYTDARLLRTPVYDEKFKLYFQKVLPQVPDSLIQDLDPIIDKARKDPEVFRYVLVTLFNYYAQSQIMGHDGVFVHLAEKYYIPEATWAGPDFIKKLQEQIDKRKPLLIGQIAPDFQMVNVPDAHFIAAKTDTALVSDVYVGNFFKLHDVKAKYIILMFWESDCGHCQKAMPELYKVYQRLRDKGVQVVAVHMLGGVEGKRKWINWVNDHGLYGWINAWNPYSYTYKETYDIKSTPILYVLDENKKIVAKLIPPEVAEEIINVLLKTESGKKK